jgi:uncharacterized membrane protein
MAPETSAVIRLVISIAFAVLFVLMGLNHFVPSSRRTMARMIPPSMRWRGWLRPANLVAFTGACEVLGGVGLLIPVLQPVAAVLLAVFLVAVFPANAYAAEHRDRFGAIAIPLVPRAIAQVVLIALLLVVAFG